MSRDGQLACRMCGQEHRPVPLAPGEKALCVRCDAVLANGKRFGPDATLIFSITGLALALPAAFLPFIAAGKFGEVRVSSLLTGVDVMWDHGMRAVAVTVLLFGAVIPVAFMGLLAALHAPARLGWRSSGFAPLATAGRLLEHWAIPEVQVLAVLVALMKLGSLVTVTIGPGFWFYCAMSLSLLFAQRSLDLNSLGRRPTLDRAASATRP